MIAQYTVQGWDRLHKPDYDYDYDYSAHEIIDYNYDYDYSAHEIIDYDYDHSAHYISDYDYYDYSIAWKCDYNDYDYNHPITIFITVTCLPWEWLYASFFYTACTLINSRHHTVQI